MGTGWSDKFTDWWKTTNVIEIFHRLQIQEFMNGIGNNIGVSMIITNDCFYGLYSQSMSYTKQLQQITLFLIIPISEK